jgi:hypothetical protein
VLGIDRAAAPALSSDAPRAKGDLRVRSGGFRVERLGSKDKGLGM